MKLLVLFSACVSLSSYVGAMPDELISEDSSKEVCARQVQKAEEDFRENQYVWKIPVRFLDGMARFASKCHLSTFGRISR